MSVDIRKLQELARDARASGEFRVLADALLEDGFIIGEHVTSSADLRIRARRWAASFAERATGRTTMIVDAAVSAALAGETVLILVGHGERESNRVDDIARGMIGDRMNEVRGEDAPDLAWHRIFVETAHSAARNIRGRNIDRVWRDHTYFEDHRVMPHEREDAEHAVEAALARSTRRASPRQSDGRPEKA